MKEAELRKHADCSICGNKVGATGLPLFWTVDIKRYGIDMRAVNRQTGLTMLLAGNAAMAAAMGPDEDMATQIGDTDSLTVCENCATHETCVAALAEADPAKPGLYGQPNVDQTHKGDLRRVLRNLLATIELQTDCMSNTVDRATLDPWIERAEDLLGEALEEIIK